MKKGETETLNVKKESGLEIWEQATDLGKVSKKKKNIVEFSTKGSDPPPPALSGKNFY